MDSENKCPQVAADECLSCMQRDYRKLCYGLISPFLCNEVLLE